MRAAFRTAAGIDVHRDTVVVSVRKKSTSAEDDRVETRTFETFRDALIQMVDWLQREAVEVVGLESTGVYWMPVVRALQEVAPKLTVWLVNPLDVKKRAGRKTDRKDSRWLSELVLYAMVTPSYIPSREQNELRKLTRHRPRPEARGPRPFLMRQQHRPQLPPHPQDAGSDRASLDAQPLREFGVRQPAELQRVDLAHRRGQSANAASEVVVVHQPPGRDRFGPALGRRKIVHHRPHFEVAAA
jgi:hypothetical protein